MADLRSLVAALRRYPDPVTSADPFTSTLVARLATLPPPQPSAGFRDELHAQLIAVAPRLIAEGVTAEAPVPTRRRRVGATWQRVPFHRPIAVVGTLVVIFAMLLTGAVWLSSGTLPGDSLYGLKRASENVQLSLLNGDGARGKEYLTLAKRRANEVAKLLARSSSLGAAAGGVHAAGGINSHTAKLVTDTLDDADADTRNASRLLTGQAVRNSSHDPLRTLLSWTPDQVSRLRDITGRIPAGALHDRAVGSQQLAERVLDRANRINGNIGCSCLTATSSDDLGPLPCTVPCNPPASKSVPPLRAPAPTGPTGAPPGGASTAPSILSSTVNGSGASASLPSIPGLPTPTGSASLPTGAPTGPGGSSGATGTAGGSAPASGPIALDSCGLHVQLGEVGVGLGPCGLHLHL